MARCLDLDGFDVDEDGGWLYVRLHSWGLDNVEHFHAVLCCAYPDLRFAKSGSPERSGLLGARWTQPARGQLTATGAVEVHAFLSLVSGVLTIEDSLNESHALAYHKDEDEFGGLVRSEMGHLVYKAKYGYSGAVGARQVVMDSLRAFVNGHPRYAAAGCLACPPPHEAGRTGSLSDRIADQLALVLQMTRIAIIRLATRQPQKDIVDDDRQKGVRMRLASQRGSMRVDADLSGQTVIVLDDLYGSGGTMTEAARALRAAGAKEVLGLAMTKQRLYEGVRLATQD